MNVDLNHRCVCGPFTHSITTNNIFRISAFVLIKQTNYHMLISEP